MTTRWRIGWALLPVMAVIVLLFGGGLAMALAQSVGYMPILRRYEVTLDAYRAVFGQEEFYRSLLLTVWIATVSTAVSTILAVLFALLLRRPFRYKKTASFLFQFNIPIPHLVGGIAILFLFAQSGFLARIGYALGLISEPAQFPALVYDPYGIGIILEYVWKTAVFTGVVVLAALHSAGDAYEEAARNLGANRWQRFRHITLPTITPAALSSSVLVFAFTFGAFEVPLLLGQRYPSVLSVLAYRSYVDVDLNARPEAMAMSVIIAAISAGLIFLYMQLIKSQVRDG